jgi:hypothetical protein
MACVTILVLITVPALTLFSIYGVDSHHENRNSIWWPERGRNLIPPTATDITLQRDLLDHYATYKVAEKDLNAFLDVRFADDGETLDSFGERSSPAPRLIGKAIGPFGWVVTEDTVCYHFTTSNGAASTYYHDPTTGRTYQDSAYW